MNKYFYDYNYHTHTFRCGHAQGTDEEYVLEAIKGGIKRLGFSDHVILPGIIDPHIRGEYYFLENYITSIRNLKEKYVSQIDIKVGFEAEYSKSFVSYYKDLLKKKKIDYLIIGQHCFFKKGETIFYLREADNKKMIKKYVKDLCKGMSTKLFSYAAHPDLFVTAISKYDGFARKMTKRILKTAKKFDVPLEINLGGIRYPRGVQNVWPESRCTYPYIEFWKSAKENGNRIIMGIDAHNPNDILTDKNERVLELIKKLDLKVEENFII